MMGREISDNDSTGACVKACFRVLKALVASTIQLKASFLNKEVSGKAMEA